MTQLNTDTSVLFLIVAGRAFHSHGSATKKVLSLSEFGPHARYVELAFFSIGADRSQEASRFWYLCLRCNVWTSAIKHSHKTA